jgi:hypothetical protein
LVFRLFGGGVRSVREALQKIARVGRKLARHAEDLGEQGGVATRIVDATLAKLSIELRDGSGPSHSISVTK